MVSKVLLALLRFYKRAISPLLGQRCRFFPTCSEYMYEAIERYGAPKGFWMGLKRLVRCQPFCRGGYDPVP
ncbi:MAG: membrane protein insertion efficiency factor YidD [Defluviitaleaceae bacterium]|nr:membrane protein insertion efficiency factor YidD [Defluviitaleaceae bacterium]